ATAGIALRAGGARAALIATVVVLAMPLLGLQSRSLTSEIGTACGAALIVYGLVALALPAGGRWARGGLAILDRALAALVLVAGMAIGFLGGGALLGLLVPIGAVAAGGSLGLPLIARLVRRAPPTPGEPGTALHVTALVATLVAASLVGLLAYQLYDLTDPYPGIMPPPRQVFGKAIVPEGCYAWSLGAIWKPEDDLRYIYDSTFEQIAYGTYPWGLLAPVAMAALLVPRGSGGAAGGGAERRDDRDGRRRVIGAICLAWAGGAWIAGEAFQRRVGFTLYGGFPAFAVAIGVWLDAAFSRIRAGDRDALPPGAALIGVFVFVGVLDLGKDLQSFTEKLTSILIGSDAIAYPKDATWLFLSARLWILVLGMTVALGLALAFILWKPDATPRRVRAVTASLAAALGASVVTAAFWTLAWHPRLAQHLSSKVLFETYEDLRGPNDALVIMGDLGHAPRAYTDQKPEVATTREQVVTALKRPGRVFAIAPQAEICPIHREMGDKPYFVVDDRNVRSLMFSNSEEGTTDKNSLREMILHEPPANIPFRPNGDIVWDGKIQLLGWDIPPRVKRGEKFEVVTYYKILGTVGGAWTMLVHIDGALRWQGGDHKPIKDRCPTSTWQVGDYIVDRHPMVAGQGASPPGSYKVWIGFFTGQTPNFTNMTVTKAPADQRDQTNRVNITGIELD
ncbi:MAG: hypothetical protein KIT31_08485, partial [Deltaproteobacteria bacterium]|nr:hypothetical protein [Deltaproteobacteria bacterium]